MIINDPNFSLLEENSSELANLILDFYGPLLKKSVADWLGIAWDESSTQSGIESSIENSTEGSVDLSSNDFASEKERRNYGGQPENINSGNKDASLNLTKKNLEEHNSNNNNTNKNISVSKSGSVYCPCCSEHNGATYCMHHVKDVESYSGSNQQASNPQQASKVCEVEQRPNIGRKCCVCYFRSALFSCIKCSCVYCGVDCSSDALRGIIIQGTNNVESLPELSISEPQDNSRGVSLQEKISKEMANRGLKFDKNVELEEQKDSSDKGKGVATESASSSNISNNSNSSSSNIFAKDMATAIEQSKKDLKRKWEDDSNQPGPSKRR